MFLEKEDKSNLKFRRIPKGITGKERIKMIEDYILIKDEKGYYYTRGQRTGRRRIAEWEKSLRLD